MRSNNIFLKKSAIDIILALDSKGLPFNEIARRTRTTSVTVATRLKELKTLGLIEVGLIDEKRVYKLTEKGKKTVPLLQKIEFLLAQVEKIASGDRLKDGL